MSIFWKISVFMFVFLIATLGAYFLIYDGKREWIVAEIQQRQGKEFDYNGKSEAPCKIENMRMRTMFVEDSNNLLKFGFLLEAALEAPENPTRETPFCEIVIKGREAGYSDRDILNMVGSAKKNGSSRINLARLNEYTDTHITNYLCRCGNYLKAVEEVVGYRCDIQFFLLDKDGFCLKGLSFQEKANDVFDYYLDSNKSSLIIPGKVCHTIQQIIDVSISENIAKRVKKVVFWPTIRPQTRFIDFGFDEDEIKKEEENSNEENSSFTE